MLSLTTMQHMLAAAARWHGDAVSVELGFLSCHFDVTKLWDAVRAGERAEIEKRLANLFVGALLLSGSLKAVDLDSLVIQRVESLQAGMDADKPTAH